MTLVGRESQLAAIAAGLRDGRSVRVVGERGTGRSALLAEAAGRYAATGATVLAVRALPGDDGLPGAGLQRLLTPVQAEAGALPAAAAAAFARLFGADPPEVAPLPLAAAVALLAEELAARGRWLWCADDLDRLDALSRTVIVSQTHLPVLAATLPQPTAHLADEVRMGRLSRGEAERVLGALPGVRAHPGARLVLAQAAGNPLALTELARHLPPPAEISPTATELPVPPRLRHALAPAVDDLDEPQLRAAVLAALAAETPGPCTASALDAAVDRALWTGLIDLGLLRPGRARRFRHPVARAAVLDRAGSARCREARHELAALLKPAGDETTQRLAAGGAAAPHVAAGGAAALHVAAGGAAARTLAPAEAGGGAAARNLARAEAGGGAAARNLAHAGADDGAAAWHLGRGAAEPDEGLATTLERTGADLARTGRVRAAAYALALAADRTPDPTLARTRRLRAAHHARLAGEPAWEAQLGISLENLGQQLRIAWLRGDTAIRVEEPPAGLMAVWARAVLDDTDPGGDVQRLINEQPRHHERMAPDERAIVLGTIAATRHETAPAVRHLTRAAASAPPGGLVRPIALGALAWAYFDGGDLDAARDAAERTLRAADADRHGEATSDTRAGALATLAAVAVLRDEPDAADRLGDARDALRPGHHALHELRLDRAQGLIAGIRGEHALAFHRLRRHYGEDGRPVHHRISDLCLADLARVRAADDRTEAIEDLVEAASSRVRTLRSARLAAVWHRAKALLAGPDPAAESYFRLALADPGTDQWAFERALTRMDYAIWLRRRQRPAESRPLLSAARDVFAAAGLAAWRERAETELAAAGRGERRDGLTPQQRQVVTLAAQGLTNAQIGARLGLSARTVGTHLSRAYPILGVTRRSQLSGMQSFDRRRADGNSGA
ncbi:LuxR C-terminal-related transcriptional regulator [Actinoplanes sp. L3-i22]|uniref:helix-turn-helix transcriptional regulator n=1 Tax=Actinoplanes sp. L3-i22 TaxID=2836373 RepID=UPI001C857252|nr:LuxR C-terminal-related transcriptional regulator [Actinoplanes sp. L3-i22]